MRTTFTEIILHERTSWFIRLRWIAIAGILLTIGTAKYIFYLEFDLVATLVIAFVMILCNSLYYYINYKYHQYLNRVEHKSYLYGFINLQMVLDLLALALLIHYSGGVENPFCFYLIFHVMIAGFFLRPLNVVFIISFAILLFAGVFLLELYKVVGHYMKGYINQEQALYENALFTWSKMVVIASAVIVLGLFVISISRTMRHREQELLDTQEKLKEKSDLLEKLERHKSEFLKFSAHQLKSPLASINSMMSTLLKVYENQIGEKPKDFINRTYNKSLFLIDMVQDLLQLSQLQDLEFVKEKEDVSLKEIIDNINESLKIKAEEKKVHLDMTIDENVPNILGYKNGIYDLIYNLTENAIKYTPTDGIVKTKLSFENNHVKGQISDTGIGIPKENLQNLFEDFFRAPNAIKSGIPGTGLGLSIVKSIITAHNGDIKVDSDEGKGTTFTFYLPVKK